MTHTGISIDVSLAIGGSVWFSEADQDSIVLLASELRVKQVVASCGDDPGVAFWLDVNWTFPLVEPLNRDDECDPEVDRMEDFAASNIHNFVRLPAGFTIQSEWVSGVYDESRGHWIREY